MVRNSLWLRIAVAIGLHLFIGEEFFAPDQVTYHYGGSRLALYWLGRHSTYPTGLIDASTQRGYYYLLAALYTVLGRFNLIPKLVNALVGAYIVKRIYQLATRVTGSHAVALRAATYVAFLPSLVLWSALNVRDIWVILFIVVICDEALALRERFSPRALLLVALAAIGLSQFRSYVLLAVMGSVGASFLVFGKTALAQRALLTAGASLVLTYLGFLGGSANQFQSPDLEALQEMRRASGMAGTVVASDVDISTPGAALVFLPYGLAVFLLAPFPWAITGLRQFLTLPEMLFVYSRVLPTLRGMASLLRERLSQSLGVVLVTIALTFGYALGQSNIGTAYRHRAQVLPFLMIFAAWGVEIALRPRFALPPKVEP